MQTLTNSTYQFTWFFFLFFFMWNKWSSETIRIFLWIFLNKFSVCVWRKKKHDSYVLAAAVNEWVCENVGFFFPKCILHTTIKCVHVSAGIVISFRKNITFVVLWAHANVTTLEFSTASRIFFFCIFFKIKTHMCVVPGEKNPFF